MSGAFDVISLARSKQLSRAVWEVHNEVRRDPQALIQDLENDLKHFQGSRGLFEFVARIQRSFMVGDVQVTQFGTRESPGWFLKKGHPPGTRRSIS